MIETMLSWSMGIPDWLIHRPGAVLAMAGALAAILLAAYLLTRKEG